tara:strand:- start:797 stop:1000 length:204 start_codon:yes stop_codon:yes gene_type:complete
MEITRVSNLTGVTRTLDLNVTANQMIDYDKGMKVDYAFPNLTPAEREFFVTGIIEEEVKKFVDGIGL